MLRHGKWRASDSSDYLSPLGNSVVRGFLIFSRPSVSFMRVFNPFSVNNLNFFRIFSRSNLFSLWHDRLLRSKGFKTFINIVYKRKADKVRPVDSDKFNDSTPDNNENWK
jgi:hypothetical protein